MKKIEINFPKPLYTEPPSAFAIAKKAPFLTAAKLAIASLPFFGDLVFYSKYCMKYEKATNESFKLASILKLVGSIFASLALYALSIPMPIVIIYGSVNIGICLCDLLQQKESLSSPSQENLSESRFNNLII